MMDARRLAALDMWGTAGSPKRRQVIRAEFALGVLGCLGLGVLSLANGEGWAIVLGTWLAGAGANYLPLAIHDHSVMRPGELERELERAQLPHDLRRAGVQQLWIAVPFAVAGRSLVRRRA